MLDRGDDGERYAIDAGRRDPEIIKELTHCSFGQIVCRGRKETAKVAAPYTVISCRRLTRAWKGLLHGPFSFFWRGPPCAAGRAYTLDAPPPRPSAVERRPHQGAPYRLGRL